TATARPVTLAALAAGTDGSPARSASKVRRPRSLGTSRPQAGGCAPVACAALVAAGLGVNHLLTARSAGDDAAVNPNCTLIVPANPLSAQGLATPYQLTATDPANGPCNEANNNQTAFVQG